MHLNCPECENQIKSDDIHLVKTIAICQSCNNIFDFTNELKEANLPAFTNPKPEIVMPHGIEVLKLMNELEIMIKWRSISNNFTIFFAVFWNLFIGIFTLAVTLSGSWMMLLFMLPFLAVGAYLIYSSVSYLVNKTFIIVDQEGISIEHRPINFLIQKDNFIFKEDIRQLYVKRYSVGSQNGRQVYAFSLEVTLNSGKEITLLKNLKSLEHGHYIEQEIENYLGIKNTVAKGEWASREKKA